MSPQYFDDLLYKIMARVENGFGRLEEGQVQNRMAAEARAKDLHKRIDKVEDRLWGIEKGKDSSAISILKLAILHWREILWLVTMGLVVLGLVKPDTLKGIASLSK